MNNSPQRDEIARKAIEALLPLQEIGDKEADHVAADQVLCDLLRDLGFGDVVDEWDKVEKWYA